ncbi:MAG: hypothetical protein A2Y28_02085 [Chlamydiae bacterium GWC2_50_10]|nr:MAG: hypothetical protein A2Y28_02085 [Chlamydiae bacterium GWC2_50_10]OGN55158.1 MAG: hypothetical protein A2098_03020 [Chlamydiae bacterium GWF2_49_8]OGN64610.1 MAG: hypothetical protein A3E26_04265 [Chlamydiae bacterium RIFCSPHIGHO2_12_FULL_49_32]OGN68020.1 MAG: hypothetical protein A3I15_00020 [Chlamydiae bacterium RIFCSPLOWO2_02_FULL_49_12]HCJ84212.1 hypothetical protein [Parachlamydiales bacterium]
MVLLKYSQGNSPLPGLNNSPESKYLEAFGPKKFQSRAKRFLKPSMIPAVMLICSAGMTEAKAKDPKAKIKKMRSIEMKTDFGYSFFNYLMKFDFLNQRSILISLLSLVLWRVKDFLSKKESEGLEKSSMLR